jgi:hypothetical protein
MNNRPAFVTENDIERWDIELEGDHTLPTELFDNPTVKEVCYAGLWLCEQLEDLKCPPEYIVRIQYSAGKCSFGREPWEVHQKFLESYKLNDMQFEPEPGNIN